MLDVFIDEFHQALFGTTKHEVVESSDSMNYYHLRLKGETDSLCGAKVINSKRKLSEWGSKQNMAHWCTKCRGLTQELS